MLLAIHPLLQFLPHLEIRQPLRLHLDLFSCLRIPSSIGLIISHHEAAEPPDLDPVSFHQGIYESIEYEVNDPGGPYFGQVVLGA